VKGITAPLHVDDEAVFLSSAGRDHGYRSRVLSFGLDTHEPDGEALAADSHQILLFAGDCGITDAANFGISAIRCRDIRHTFMSCVVSGASSCGIGLKPARPFELPDDFTVYLV